MRIRSLLLSLILVTLLLNGSSVGLAQQAKTEEYFPTYGHWVRGDLLRFYSSVDDPKRIIGEPITDAIDDPSRPGIQLQYFERMRMDYNAKQPEGKRVTLAQLGVYLHQEPDRNPTLALAANACRVFPNGKQVCLAFLSMYDRYGETIFGMPITNAEYQNDVIVQYFENARMEWRPEMPIQNRVVISPLGRIDFDQRIGNTLLLAPQDPRGNSPTTPLHLKVYAFPANALLAVGQEQQIFVLVMDQLDRPVKDANVRIRVTYPDGSQVIPNTDGRTNEMGYTSGHFTVQNVPPNSVVQVAAEADNAGVNQSAGAWFRTWW